MAHWAKCAIFSLFTVFVYVSIKDLFLPATASIEKQIPVTKIDRLTGPVLKFQYCYSCGYEKAFQEYANIIQQKYPHIHVEGENYQPPKINLVISRVLAFSRFSLIFLIVTGFNIFEILQIGQPIWWSWCIDNKLYSSMMVYFMCNSFESMLMSTGAFEITFNDVPVWSKLETGRIPQPPELFQIIDNTLQFQNKADIKARFPK